MSKQSKQNLKHGYIFLIITLMIPFLISFGIEMHLTGGIDFSFLNASKQNTKEPNDEDLVDEEVDSEESSLSIEIRNLTDGFKTKEESITVVGLTQKENEVWVNGNKVNVATDGSFESKVDLIAGENVIRITAKSSLEKEISKSMTIIREVPKKEEPQTQTPPIQIAPPVQNPQPPQQPSSPPAPTPPAPPPPQQITGLKLSCSVSNTAPMVGGNVSINCSIKDQNNNGVSGAFGYVTMNWQTGSSVYTLSSSNGNGDMSTSFNVPAGNAGSISGSVQASKDGLNVSSNFTINVQ